MCQEVLHDGGQAEAGLAQLNRLHPVVRCRIADPYSFDTDPDPAF
jgi:hypothetical protein